MLNGHIVTNCSVLHFIFKVDSCYNVSRLTVLDLITAQTLINTQSSNFLVFRLQIMYFYLLPY